MDVLCENHSVVPAAFTNDFPNNTVDSTENIHVLPVWKQIIWCALFGIIVIVATGGNAIVIWIVFCNRRMRSVTNYFLVNLSVADILVSTLNVIFSFTYMLRNDWPFGKFYCVLTQFVSVLSISASVFTLVAISGDRYMAILHPLSPRMSKLKTLFIIVCIWGFSIVVSLPMLIYSDTKVFSSELGVSRTVCSAIWPDGMPPESYQDYIFRQGFQSVFWYCFGYKKKSSDGNDYCFKYTSTKIQNEDNISLHERPSNLA